MTGCLIEAGLWIVDAGEDDVRFDAAIRVDGGMIAQIGAWEAVAYGNESLPRLGARDAVAVPVFIAAPTLADDFGGAPGRLTPGSPATLALFPAGVAPTRAALAAALRGEASGLRDLIVGGRAWIADGRRLAVDAAGIDEAASAEEDLIWAAVERHILK